MTRTMRWAGAGALLLMLALIAACRGTSERKDQATDPPPTATVAAARAHSEETATGERVIGADCLNGATAYRYSGAFKVAFAGSPLGGGGGANGVPFSGAFVAPNRTYTKLEIPGQESETISIGADTWTRAGSGPWVKATGGAGDSFAFNPNSFCREQLGNLGRAGVAPVNDTVDGVPALRYDFDKAALGRGGFDLGGAGSVADLPDNTAVALWVTERERWPVRVDITGDGTGSGNPLAFAIRFNVTDLNNDSVKVEPPQ